MLHLVPDRMSQSHKVQVIRLLCHVVTLSATRCATGSAQPQPDRHTHTHGHLLTRRHARRRTVLQFHHSTSLALVVSDGRVPGEDR